MFSNIFASINIFSSWDILVLVIFIVLVFLYGLTAGREKIIALILSAYFSYLILLVMPWYRLGFIGLRKAPPSTTQIFVFLALSLAILFLLPRSSLGFGMKIGRSKRGWGKILIFSILWVGLIISLVLSFLPSSGLAQMKLKVMPLFTGDLAQFIWLVLPILALLFFRTTRRE